MTTVSQKCQTTRQGSQRTAFCVWGGDTVEAVAEGKVVAGVKAGGADRAVEAAALVRNLLARKGHRLVQPRLCNRWSHTG